MNKTHSPFGRSMARSLTAGVLVVTLASCHAWKPATVVDIRSGKEDRDHGMRLYFPEGTVELRENWILEYPLVVGEVAQTTGQVQGEARPPLRKGSTVPVQAFDLDKTQRVELLKTDGGKTAVLAVSLSVAGVVAIAAIIAATKSSCPFVYVDEGTGERLVGEGYPGAVFRSIQRDDLLALPIRGEGAARVRLVNWAPETQYTDRLNLALVDHDPAQRAVATADARVLIVGPSQGPESATDLEGVDRLAALRAADGYVWSTDLRRVSTLPRTPTREGFEASFATPGGRPVLELHLKTTKWMEVVFARFFTMMGSRFDRIVKNANEKGGPEIRKWRRREGVDLRVEALRRGRWETVDYVQATGAVAMRDVAIPFPEDWPEDMPVKVRLSGGTGFWRVDAIALSSLMNERPQVRLLAPEHAVGMDGSDQLAILAAADHRYHELAEYGDWLETSFSLPAVPPGLNRSVFLDVNGYYNPHPPARPEPALRKLRQIRDEEGALAHYGVDFFRDLGLHSVSRATAGP
jgi:hypothetical protein